jgi:hypothetical protein
MRVGTPEFQNVNVADGIFRCFGRKAQGLSQADFSA